jgi:CHAD domain-containing protein
VTERRTAEHELELGVGPGFELSDLLNGTPASKPEKGQLEAVYFDTPDLRLLRRGVSVRFRRGEEPADVWTAELPDLARGVGLAWREISIPGTPDSLPLLLEDLVRGWALGGPIVAVARLRTLRSVGAQPVDQLPKLVGALRPSALAPWDLAAPRVASSPSAGELVRAALVASAASLVDHLAAVVLDEGPDGVHQARVGIRRLRSDLKTAQTLLDWRRVRPLRRELDWLMDQLGEVRDLDVLLAGLRTDARVLDLADEVGADAVLSRARHDRSEAYERLRSALRTPRCAALLEATARLSADPPFKSPAASRPAKEVLPRLVRQPLKDLRREVRKQGRHPDDEGLHRIRISAKRVRYAAELAAPAAGKKARRAARRLARLQKVLGEHNDASVANSRLRDLGSRTGPEGAWAAGLFGGLQLARAAKCRERFPPVWAEAAAGQRWRWTKK